MFDFQSVNISAILSFVGQNFIFKNNSLTDTTQLRYKICKEYHSVLKVLPLYATIPGFNPIKQAGKIWL